jgi:hypothetical protein
MATSTVPACKAAILTILDAVTDLDAVTQSWSAPTKDEDFTGEMIFLGEVTNEEAWASLGNMRRRETYTVALTVWVEQWGDDPQAAEQRAYAIWGLVTEALRDDLRPPTSVLRTAGVQQYDGIRFRQITGPATAEKWGARIDASITFTATTV